MRDATSDSVPRWPFFLGDITLFALACFIYFTSRPTPGHWEITACAACVALGAALGVWPFVLDHRARLKLLDAHALGSIGEKLQGLERLTAQISSATNE